MSQTVSSPFQLTVGDLKRLLVSDTPLFPELEAARQNVAALRDAPGTQVVLAQTQPLMGSITQIPPTNYTFYRFFVRNGDRRMYQTPYFLKRTKLAAAALRLFLGHADEFDVPTQIDDAYAADERSAATRSAAGQGYRITLNDVVHDYLWSICEESNWVVPAHEDRAIDLFAAETGFMLAETLALLGDSLHAEVRHRVRAEIERRIFDPYLRLHHSLWWYRGSNNWNGVCNSAVAATFLLLEPEPGRAAAALKVALNGLQVFLDNAFEKDGASTEGVSYWHYGLINFVALSEMLRARSGGAIDLLNSEHVQNVAAYPAKMQLSGPWFASFSDCDETVTFNPGIVTRLAERTGEKSLLNLLAHPTRPGGDWRLPMMLRNMLWWNGSQREAVQVGDSVLPVGGVVRLVGRTPDGAPIVLAIKAGHNAEHHNQNDIGSFILHADGENLLTDPGRGLYNRFYFGPQRYENIFANSYGHSVPRIGGQLQSPGREFSGELLHVDMAGPLKRAQVEFARAYPVEGLASIRREVSLAAEDGTVWLQDDFRFSGSSHTIEEALITWLDVEVDGGTALLRGQRHSLRLTIESPPDTSFSLERLEDQSQMNAKPGVLKRLSFLLPISTKTQARVRMEVLL